MEPSADRHRHSVQGVVLLGLFMIPESRSLKGDRYFMSLKEFFKNLWQSSAPNIVPTLDLHGLSVKSAIAETKAFLETSQRAGIQEVRIVYGKGLGSPGGQGVLRQVIPSWCEKEGSIYVESFQREVDARGGDGSILILVKKHLPREEVSDRLE